MKWIEQQLKNFVYTFDNPVYLIRDNDMLFSHIDFEQFDIKDVPISFHAPNMNAIVERFIGSFKREALDNFIIVGENQFRNIVKEYVDFYNKFRPHQGLGNVPIPDYESGNYADQSTFHSSPKGKIGKKEFLSGILNHYYYETAA